MTGVTLAPLPRSETHRVLHLRLPEDQKVFGGDIAETAADPDPETDFHVIEASGAVVGFFKIERPYGTRYDFAPAGALGLRMLQIDAGAQGFGYGRAAFAALPGYLRERYPDRSECWLTVNCRNPRAGHVYLSGGWEDTGELYHGGPAGPQHIMRLSLVPVAGRGLSAPSCA
ncbi:N-acetyltransferase [Histidinibacterium aquaticum]|uniref:GNAT family N-acetyltransferase n=1 Tax=Histidinibacterium aquaticum TaxID=2613962 RepID=A0A5J5GQ62_9RHOB|nr:GNAT family N-acetyltransferase [Histidinibacterium aquaticum]KAA9010197.1 GNAT family N-acetyltransferase [Histidinibacterium aquaticum]